MNYNGLTLIAEASAGLDKRSFVLPAATALKLLSAYWAYGAARRGIAAAGRAGEALQYGMPGQAFRHGVGALGEGLFAAGSFAGAPVMQAATRWGRLGRGLKYVAPMALAGVSGDSFTPAQLSAMVAGRGRQAYEDAYNPKPPPQPRQSPDPAAARSRAAYEDAYKTAADRVYAEKPVKALIQMALLGAVLGGGGAAIGNFATGEKRMSPMLAALVGAGAGLGFGALGVDWKLNRQGAFRNKLDSVTGNTDIDVAGVQKRLDAITGVIPEGSKQ